MTDLKYKRSKTNPNLNNSDFRPYQSCYDSKKRSKVVYSSKGTLGEQRTERNLDQI